MGGQTVLLVSLGPQDLEGAERWAPAYPAPPHLFPWRMILCGIIPHLLFFSVWEDVQCACIYTHRSCFQPSADVSGSGKYNSLTESVFEHKVTSLQAIFNHATGWLVRDRKQILYILKATFEVMVACTNKLEEIQLMVMHSRKLRGIKIYTFKIRNNSIALNS